jgi:transketolase
MVGIQNRFGVSGEAEELFEYFGLTPKNIVIAAREVLKMKG